MLNVRKIDLKVLFLCFMYWTWKMDENNEKWIFGSVLLVLTFCIVATTVLHVRISALTERPRNTCMRHDEGVLPPNSNYGLVRSDSCTTRKPTLFLKIKRRTGDSDFQHSHQLNGKPQKCVVNQGCPLKLLRHSTQKRLTNDKSLCTKLP